MADEYVTRQSVQDTARAILKDPILIMAVDAVAKAAPGVELVMDSAGAEKRESMADKLISADALLEEIAKVKKCIASDNSDYLTGYVCALSGVEGQIAYQPTIDAVPVVQCKDCGGYSTSGCATGFGWCGHLDRGMMDNDFCSHGGRRTDGN